MHLKKINEADISYKRWPRTLVEAFGPEAELYVEPKRMPLRERIAAFAVMVLIGIGWYLIVGIKAGAQ